MSIATIEELRTVLRIAELGSLSAAAAAKGESVNAVSRRLSALEARLGVPLFHRTTRRLAVTDEGNALCARAPRVLSELDALEAAVVPRSRRLAGLVRVGIRPELIHERWFGQLDRLLATHPALAVQLTVDTRLTDPYGRGLDLWVHFGQPPPSSLVARRLGATAWVLAAAPSYVARRGAPRSVAELADHDCLRGLREGREHHWALKDAHGREHMAAVTGRFESDDPNALATALYAGLGIGFRPRGEVERAVDDGRLVAILSGHRSWSVPIYLLMPRARSRLPRVRLVADLVTEAALTMIADDAG